MKYIGFFIFLSSCTNAELTVVLEINRYKYNVISKGGFVKISREAMSLFMAEKVFSHSSSHANFFLVLRSLKNGFPFSASLGMNLESALKRPLSC